MRTIATLAVLAACSSGSAPTESKPAPTTTPSAPPTATKPAPTTLEQLISADTIGVVRQPGDQLIVMRYVHDLFVGLSGTEAAPACITDLEQRVKAGYQMSLGLGSAYFVLETDAPQADVASCFASATREEITGEQEGELFAFHSRIGVAYTAWRAPYVVIGNRAQVEAALHTNTKDIATRWRGFLAPAAAAPTWMVRIDRSLDDLVGEHTTDYVFVLDKLEPPPRSLFAGRFIVHYASAADADAAERHMRGWIARGKFPRRIEGAPAVAKLYDDIAAALQKATIKRTPTAIEIGFDSQLFGGLDNLAKVMEAVGNVVK